jgi:oligopeptide transport system substrate-binding protein
VESWQHESEFVLVKNDLYYDAASIKLNKLVAKVITDANTVLNMFETGELDWIEVGSTIKAAVIADGYELSSFGDGATFYIQANINEKSVTSNLNIRKAIAYALDRASFVTNVLQNNSLPAYYYTTPEIKGPDGVTPFGAPVEILFEDNNAELAKEYWNKGCEELGKTSEEVAKALSLIADDTTAALNNAAAVQEYMRVNLGVDITVENMPFKSRLERTTARDYSIVFGGWGPDYNDPLTFLEIITTGNGNNTGDWSNAEYDEDIAKSRLETDPEARNALLVRCEQIIQEDLPIIPLYHRMKDYVVEDGLAGMFRTAFQDYNLINAYWE